MRHLFLLKMRATTMALFMAACCDATAAWDLPTSEKFKPLLAACEGTEALQNCSATFLGTCETRLGGARVCAQPAERHCFWGIMTAFRHKLGFHRTDAKGPRGLPWQPQYAGDCSDKRDGEACTFSRPGQCIPSGRCPVFQGRVVCKPWDAHPPRFVTRPCRDRRAGSRCRLGLLPGMCEKAKYEDFLRCRTWPFQLGRPRNTIMGRRSALPSAVPAAPQAASMRKQESTIASTFAPPAVEDAVALPANLTDAAGSSQERTDAVVHFWKGSGEDKEGAGEVKGVMV